MKFKIPFTFSDIEILRRRSRSFTKFAPKKIGKLDQYLENANQKIDRKGYISICYRSFIINFFILSVIFTSIFGVLTVEYFYFMD